MRLRVEDLHGGYTAGHDILRGLTLDVPAGETTGIIGLNGSGKSTLARAVMNMLPHRRGRILLDGRNVSGLATHEIARAGVGLFMQGGRVFDELTVGENLRAAADAAGGFRLFDFVSTWRTRLFTSVHRKLQTANRFSIEKAIDFFGFPRSMLHQRADKLSGGQRHILALAMTLAQEPGLVILDEPSAGLDPQATETMYALLTTLRQTSKTTLLLIEQNISRAITFCDSVNLIRSGIVDGHCSNKEAFG